MNKRTTHTRIYTDDLCKIEELKRNINLIEKKRIGTPEVLRRTFNIPKLDNILFSDAEMKRRIKHG